jgi:hypothetical protein
MTYLWEFEIAGRPLLPLGQKCHRGPMIDVETRMSQPCVTIQDAEKLRYHLLKNIVDTSNPAVQTREVILRVFNSNLNAIFTRLADQRQTLQVTICEKRNSLYIDEDVKVLDRFYMQVLPRLMDYGVNRQNVDLISAALSSNSAIMRVAARCAIVLLVAYIELDL